MGRKSHTWAPLSQKTISRYCPFKSWAAPPFYPYGGGRARGGPRGARGGAANQHVSIRPDIDNNPIIIPLSRSPSTLVPPSPIPPYLTLQNQCTYVFIVIFLNMYKKIFELRGNSQCSANSKLFHAAIVLENAQRNVLTPNFRRKRYGERKRQVRRSSLNIWQIVGCRETVFSCPHLVKISNKQYWQKGNGLYVTRYKVLYKNVHE
jgi:hypothetical protein